MEHNETKKKIAALIDGEVKGDEKVSILSHIEQCDECKKEYDILLSNDMYLKKGMELQPSSFFNSKLNQKIGQAPARKPVFWLERLIPVPLVMGLLVLFVSGMLVTAPVLYASNNGNIRVQAKDMAGKAFAACLAGSVFAPAAFAKFCDVCNMNMCTCCTGKTRQKCTMGGNKNGK
jgi:anti-sigma factor RsiW